MRKKITKFAICMLMLISLIAVASATEITPTISPKEVVKDDGLFFIGFDQFQYKGADKITDAIPEMKIKYKGTGETVRALVKVVDGKAEAVFDSFFGIDNIYFKVVSASDPKQNDFDINVIDIGQKVIPTPDCEISDTLKETEFRSYLLKSDSNRNYIITNLLVTDSGKLVTRFKVNDEFTKNLREGDSDVLSDGTVIEVLDIVNGPNTNSDDSSTFCLTVVKCIGGKIYQVQCKPGIPCPPICECPKGEFLSDGVCTIRPPTDVTLTISPTQVVKDNEFFFINDEQFQYKGSDKITDANAQIKIKHEGTGETATTIVKVVDGKAEAVFDSFFGIDNIYFKVVSASDPKQNDFDINVIFYKDTVSPTGSKCIGGKLIQPFCKAGIPCPKECVCPKDSILKDGVCSLLPPPLEGHCVFPLVFQDGKCVEPEEILQPDIFNPKVSMELSKYPDGLIFKNLFAATVVVGDTAPASDVIGATDILAAVVNKDQPKELIPSNIPITDVKPAKLASLIKDPFNQNIISVGNPCNNPISAKLLGNPKFCLKGFNEGEGIIKVFNYNSYTQILVAGYTNSDTRRTANVLANWELYNLRGSEIRVTGTQKNPIVSVPDEILIPSEPGVPQPIPTPVPIPIETCKDGTKNQDEEGIDCGGPCKPCATSSVPTCTDEIMNGGEDDIDCGGPCKPCARTVDSCNGCLKDSTCLPFGTRLVEDEAMYCAISKKFEDQKKLEGNCQNNYECLSNQCSSGACVSLQAELQETRGLLNKILSWIGKLFG